MKMKTVTLVALMAISAITAGCVGYDTNTVCLYYCNGVPLKHSTWVNADQITCITNDSMLINTTQQYGSLWVTCQ